MCTCISLFLCWCHVFLVDRHRNDECMSINSFCMYSYALFVDLHDWIIIVLVLKQKVKVHMHACVVSLIIRVADNCHQLISCL